MPPNFAAGDDKDVFFARAMTELAHILKRTSEEIYHSASTASRIDMAQAALNLDESLVEWKSRLSPVFDVDSTSLTEPESITKRKVVLKLREYLATLELLSLTLCYRVL
jgi:hypothetical protein